MGWNGTMRADRWGVIGRISRALNRKKNSQKITFRDDGGCSYILQGGLEAMTLYSRVWHFGRQRKSTKITKNNNNKHKNI